jgi:hypothetical protein
MPWDDAGVARGPGDSGIEPDSGEVADTGFDAAPSCSGVATACSLASSCASVLGCTLQGSCGGLSAECFYQQGDVACISLQGCVWDQGTNSCTGSAWSCNLFNGSASCVGQQGCSWTSMCAGTATPCASIPAASCTTQPGCVLQ